MKQGFIRYFILFFLLFAGKLFGQDPHLSQYESTTQYLNPATTGMFDGNIRLNAHYRNQWRSISPNPFETSAFSIDARGKKFNYGGFIVNTRAGKGNLNVFNFILSGAYDFGLKNQDHRFSVGLQAGLIQKSINPENFSWGNQYNSSLSNGNGDFDPAASSGENFVATRVLLPELNIGGIYYYANPTVRINPFLGFSAFHLTQPKESFFGDDNRLPRRYLVHGGSKFILSEKFHAGVYLLGMRQRNAWEVTTTILGYYNLKESKTFLLFGPTYRSKDALIFHLGVKFGDFTYRMSYDINTSSLKNISNGRGGFELSLIYVFRKVDVPVILPCPRL